METINATVVTRSGIATTLVELYAFDRLRVQYPNVVIKALLALYAEYNLAFKRLIEANREWPTDYQYCMLEDTPVNWGVQIDMTGLPSELLAEMASMPELKVREILRRRIFEIENSLALYSILDRVCDRPNGEPSCYSREFRALLDSIRRRFGKPIALLAVTDEKYHTMKETEFGVLNGASVSDVQIREISGFDRLFGPEQFREYLARNGGECGYLLYVRASDPVAKMRKPALVVEHPLLSDPEMRRLIKANCITLNIDNPEWVTGEPRINDTKAYMPPMGMAFLIEHPNDLLSPEYVAYLESKKNACDPNRYANFTGVTRLSERFTAYLVSHGVNPRDVEFCVVKLRAKPMKGTYGCYGHERGSLSDGEFLLRVRQWIPKRGAYLVQPEYDVPVATNEADGVSYAFIDRVFLGMGSAPVFIGGFREFLPADSQEAKAGRLHGNRKTVFSEIEPE